MEGAAPACASRLAVPTLALARSAMSPLSSQGWRAEVVRGYGVFIVRVEEYDCGNEKSTDLQSCGGAIVKRQNQVNPVLRSGTEAVV